MHTYIIHTHVRTSIGLTVEPNHFNVVLINSTNTNSNSHTHTNACIKRSLLTFMAALREYFTYWKLLAKLFALSWWRTIYWSFSFKMVFRYQLNCNFLIMNVQCKKLKLFVVLFCWEYIIHRFKRNTIIIFNNNFVFVFAHGSFESAHRVSVSIYMCVCEFAWKFLSLFCGHVTITTTRYGARIWYTKLIELLSALSIRFRYFIWLHFVKILEMAETKTTK